MLLRITEVHRIDDHPDVGAALQIRAELIAMRDAGCAVLVVSEELDELFEISDRLMVLAKGRIQRSEDQLTHCANLGLTTPELPI